MIEMMIMMMMIEMMMTTDLMMMSDKNDIRLKNCTSENT
jgi:hypothetical protein